MVLEHKSERFNTENMIQKMTLQGDEVFTGDMIIESDTKAKVSKHKQSRKPGKQKSSLRMLINCMKPF